MKIKIELTSEEYDLLESYLDDRIRNDFTEARFGAIIEAMERGFAEWQKEQIRVCFDCGGEMEITSGGACDDCYEERMKDE